ncbi:hypothetical protein [Micromonospora haikouensis]|uniref:hypothetical protein n=1 Tax=Micromonospora haikouensis TaxID=686309 RepID=UPI003D9233FB
MGDHLQVATGMPPWRPSADSSLVAEYSYFDFPTSGVIEQHGAEFVFRCFAGADEDVSFWMYTLIQTSERHLLESAPSPQDFERILDEIKFHRPVTVAVAIEGIGIAAHTTLNYWHGDQPLKLATNMLIERLQHFAVHAREVADLS